MSSILKALKKLEHEKSVRKPYSFRIDAEILRGTANHKTFSTGASLAAIALFLCGAGATYMYMKQDKSTSSIQQSYTSINEDKSEPSTGAAPFPVSKSTSAVAKPRSSTKVTTVSEKSKTSSRSIEKNQTPRVKSVEMVPQVVTSAPKPVSLTVPVAPPTKTVLKVNGIAFQDGADSVAVINGITVSNGSVIEGAKVEEIHKDFVRLSRDGEKFDINLKESNL
jgi:general secretion pathway protein B